MTSRDGSNTRDSSTTILLVAIMAVVALVTAGAAIFLLYRTALDEERLRLVETARSQARLMEAVARYDRATWHGDVQRGAEATLSQIRDAHEHYVGVGDTGELVIARRQDDHIEFLLRHSQDEVYETESIHTQAGYGEPMRRALAGQTGSMIGRDYRGVIVLAAYEPVAELNLGLVAKIDLAEIQAPYRRAGYLVLGITAVLVLAGTVVFTRITNPLVRALRKNAERFELAAAGSGTGVFDWPDVGRDEIWLSGTIYSLLGYEPGELPASADHFWSMSHPDDVQATRSALQNHLEHGTPCDFECRLRKKSGEYRWFHVRAQTQRSDIAGAVRMSGSAHDVTERKRAELALAEKERTLSSLISNLPGAVYRCPDDPEGAMYFVSDRIRDLCGYPKEDIISGSVSFRRDIVHEADRARVSKELQAARSETRPHLLEYRIATADGREKWVWEQGMLVRMPDGETVREGYIIDITDRKRAEEELLKLNRALRTVSRCNEVLVRAEDEAGLAQGICRTIVEQGGFVDAWVGYPEADVLKTVRWIACFGQRDAHPDALIVRWGEDEYARGASGRAIRTGRPVVIGDMETDPDLAPWREHVRKFGYRSCLALPLIHGNETLGVLKINAAERHAFSESGAQLLAGLADNLAYGIVWLRGRKRERDAMQALEASEMRLRTIIDHNADGLLVMDENSRITFANSAASRLLGRPPHDLTGIEFGLPAGASEGSTVDLLRPDGLPMLVELRSVEIDWEGAPAFVVSLHDVTERERTERELSKLSHAVEQSPASVVITDPDGTIEYVNETFTRVTGYTSEEAVGANPRILKSGHTSPEEYRQLWQTILAGETWRGELHNRRKDGELFMESATISPICSADGEIINFIAVKEDVTEIKRTQQQLQQAQKMEAVGNLTGGIAHDFNNLLGVVLGNLQLMERRLQRQPAGADEQTMRRMQIAIDAVLRGADLTRRLLAFSRRQVLDPRTLNLNELVGGMREMLERTLGETIEVRVVKEHDLWTVHVDHAQTENALLNLAVNARDAMPDGGVLSIETANVELDEAYAARNPYVKPGRYVQLSVSDTGQGMSPEVLAHAFEPFFTTKEQGKGTGLGLSMVYGFVKQSKGHVNVYSELGSGTTIKIYFPQVPGVPEADHGREDGAESPGGSETLLVVEDDPALRETAVTFLEQLGYRVLEAASGAEALTLVEAESGVALLFTDVIMPGGMNGAELARAAREIRPKLRVLFTSGYSRDALSSGTLRELEGDVINKPYPMDALARQIRQSLDREV